MAKTSIGWCDHSINPFRARNIETGKVGHHCVKISVGCKNCYSSRMQSPFLTKLEFVATNTPKVELFFEEKAIQEVLARKKPTRYFWCDMTDMFMDGYPDEWIDRCFAAMALTPWHTHLVLTKRADRMHRWFETVPLGGHDGASDSAQYRMACAISSLGIGRVGVTAKWPLPNVWLGVSAENQETADGRIPLLLQTPAAKHFVSYEPALGPVDFEHLPSLSGIGRYLNALEQYTCSGSDIKGRLDWIIVGGESGPGARPFDIAWARKTVEQCKAAGVACFVKQLGAKPWNSKELGVDHLFNPCGHECDCCDDCGQKHGQMARILHPQIIKLGDKKGEDWDQWPSALNDLKVREFPV